MRTSATAAAGLALVLLVVGCAPTADCPLTGRFAVRVGRLSPTPAAWLADVPSCGDQGDLPDGTVVSFDTVSLDPNVCTGSANVAASTVVETRTTDTGARGLSYYSPTIAGFVYGTVPSGCEGGWEIQVAPLEGGGVIVARSFTPDLVGSCPPIPAPTSLTKPVCIDYFEAALVE